MAFIKTNLFLLALIFTACSEFPDVKPTVLDTQLEEGRVYNIIDKKNFTIQYSHSITIPEMNGYFCLSQEDFAAVKKYAVDNQNKCNRQ
jgi:hypothetical protein